MLGVQKRVKSSSFRSQAERSLNPVDRFRRPPPHFHISKSVEFISKSQQHDDQAKYFPIPCFRPPLHYRRSTEWSADGTDLRWY